MIVICHANSMSPSSFITDQLIPSLKKGDNLFYQTLNFWVGKLHAKFPNSDQNHQKVKDRVTEVKQYAPLFLPKDYELLYEQCQWPLPGRCVVCVCSNGHAAHCWTSVEWKNTLLCCLLPFDVAAGPAVLPKEMPKEIQNLYYMERECIVLLLILLSLPVDSRET